MIRLGLCCIFRKEPVKFRTTTFRYVSRFSRKERLKYLSDICLHNAENLLAAVKACSRLKIGAFRINSQFFPLYTHPKAGYRYDDLPDGQEITAKFANVKAFRKKHDIRLSFHPDQFVVLSSPRPEVVKSSIAELEYQNAVAEMAGADVINIHGGGVYGCKKEALARFAKTFTRLSKSLQHRLTVENDDNSYTPEDLLPLCEKLGIPLVYDVHHHRCKPDNMSIQKATEAAITSWKSSKRGEPYFHLSSPKDGWQGADPRRHADYINPDDFPECWKNLNVTIDLEAKAKELAISKLAKQLEFKCISI